MRCSECGSFIGGLIFWVRYVGVEPVGLERVTGDCKRCGGVQVAEIELGWCWEDLDSLGLR